MSVTEKDNVFYCDCGFSWRRGMSGSHYCEDGLREKLDAAEKCIAEHRKVLNSLAAVARRYLPDYDEHPEIQAADELLESTAGICVKGE